MLRRWFLNVVIIMIVAYLLSGVEYSGVIPLVAAGAILGLANASIRPLLLLITLPLNIITLGIFTFVISGFLLWLTAFLVPGFSVAGFGVAIVAAFLFTLANLVLTS
ncbi:MAG: phage holin family protein, partial [Bacillota bacterium]